MNIIKRLWQEESGQAMTEYGLIIALVAAALVVTVIAFKDKIKAVFEGLSFSAS